MKIVVTDSKLDMDYYKDVGNWTINGEKICMVDNNEHLGLIVSGTDEETKNVDANIIKCRNALFAYLNPAFSQHTNAYMENMHSTSTPFRSTSATNQKPSNQNNDSLS